MSTDLARRIKHIQANPRGVCKHIRRALGLSQEALAQLCGVSFTTVNHWERGRYKPRWTGPLLVLVRLSRQTNYRPPQRKVGPRLTERVALSPIPRDRRRQLFEMRTQAQWEMTQDFEERRQTDEARADSRIA